MCIVLFFTGKNSGDDLLKAFGGGKIFHFAQIYGKFLFPGI